jgi:magnesium chelatase subunit D
LLEGAALREELGSLLLYDAAPELLEPVAKAWRGMLTAVLGQPVRVVRLGPWSTEEDLWGRGGALPVAWRQPGLIEDEAPRLVVLGDLTRLSLAGLRACVALMGAEVASIEREGQSRRFRPRCWWLASCALSDVGQVSPHLLDRFALRVRAPAPEVDRREALQRELDGARREDEEAVRFDADTTWLVRAARVETRVTAEALAEAVARLPFAPGEGHRGQLALVRLSCALARLEHVRKARPLPPRVDVGASQVREAARLLQLPVHGAEDSRSPAEVERPPARAEPPRAPEGPDAKTAPVSRPAPPVAARQAPPVGVEEVARPTELVERAVKSPEEKQAGIVLSPLEVERVTPIQREHAPLRIPSFRAGGASVTERGVILGARPATELKDLSILHTLFAAAPYQSMRRRRVGASRRKRLLLTRSDLRSYRRAPVPQHLLVLVMDFTCAEGADWQGALRPYLAEAYVERAQVCIIQVGVQDTAQEELRARRVLARNLLVPSVGQAFEAAPGRATPLADGLDLAAATLRRMLHVGRDAVHRARLVVFTDGRGNIPLEASRTGTLPSNVGREGVEDSLRAAARIRGMRQVTSVLLKPPVTALSELPVRLADALGAEVVEVAPAVVAGEGGAP